MNKLLTLAVSVFVVAGCSMDLGGEEPEAVDDPLTKICNEYSASHGSVFLQKPTCCYDADVCHITASGTSTVIASYGEIGPTVPHIRANWANGEWSASPADLPENRKLKCACLSVLPGQFKNYSHGDPGRCVISSTIFGKLYDHTAATICFRPNIGERAFWLAGSANYNCDYHFESMPEGYCG